MVGNGLREIENKLKCKCKEVKRLVSGECIYFVVLLLFFYNFMVKIKDSELI